MNSISQDKLIGRSLELLTAAGRIVQDGSAGGVAEYALLPITADGSNRAFFRLVHRSRSLCLGVMPADNSQAGHDEARAMAAIGRHLYSKKLPIPEIMAYDEESGLVLLEDCGDLKLHDLLRRQGTAAMAEQEKAGLYKALLQFLAALQVQGAEGFDTDWCHDTARYDTRVMIEREAHYFLRQFWQGLLGEHPPAGIEEEFKDIASNAEGGVGPFFLHRDFQSRNIMVVGGSLKIIDFQGGRLGPPGYDVASVLIDPYAALPVSFQEEMLNHYLLCLRACIDCDEKMFLKQYPYLQLQRNLQILGAFAFLSIRRRKPFFRQYISPALDHLVMMLDKREMRAYTCLRHLCGEARRRLFVSPA